ncbi:hypothetical protein YC2023_038408 [Brassica napus]
MLWCNHCAKNVPGVRCGFFQATFDLACAVYLQFCEMLYIAENKNYEKLVDPSIYIPRFANVLLNGTYNKKVLKTARNIIASMKRDWIQTGRKPSGICGAALYTAALAHGIKCSKTDIVGIVHICEATLTKRLNEFVDTEAGSLNVKELKKREKEMQKRPFATNQTSNKETLHCKHQDRKPVNYGLCEECYSDFISVSGGLVGGSDPPAFPEDLLVGRILLLFRRTCWWPTEKPAKISRTETVMEKTKEVKSNKQEDGENEEEDEAEEDEEGYVESYDINTDLPNGEKLYEEEDEEEEEDGYDFGLY